MIDPQVWVTERKYNEQGFSKMKQKFFAEREKSLEWLKGLSSSNWESSYASQYGSMTAGQMSPAGLHMTICTSASSWSSDE